MSTQTQPSEKTYTKGELTVVWKAHLCIHSGHCVKGLPGVFNLQARPWINVDGAEAEAIKAQVNQCPSGALSYRMESAESPGSNPEPQTETTRARVEVIPGGPLKVAGPVDLHAELGGQPVQHDRDVFLCRCGASAKKPYCDGSHKKAEFNG
jgi:uncharacterized Fe-S cluster protein YjdI